MLARQNEAKFLDSQVELLLAHGSILVKIVKFKSFLDHFCVARFTESFLQFLP